MWQKAFTPVYSSGLVATEWQRHGEAGGLVAFVFGAVMTVSVFGGLRFSSWLRQHRVLSWVLGAAVAESACFSLVALRGEWTLAQCALFGNLLFAALLIGPGLLLRLWFGHGKRRRAACTDAAR